jgi:hypothetical protein
MTRSVRCALYQARNERDKEFMIERHCRPVVEAASQGAQAVLSGPKTGDLRRPNPPVALDVTNLPHTTDIE